MPSTPPSMARRASSGWQIPLTISGSEVIDRSHGRSSQVSGLPNSWAHLRMAAPGSTSGSWPSSLRKTGSVK